MDEFKESSGISREALEKLPLFDANILQVLNLLNNPDCNYDKLLSSLSPELSVKLLGLANSAFYGVTVKSLRHALQVLGLNTIKQTLVASYLEHHFQSHTRPGTFKLDRFYAQAHLCTAISKTLGQITDYPTPGELFTVSMMHNIGKLVLAVYFPDPYQRIKDLKTAGRMSSYQAEMEVLGLSHAELSSIILDKFNIPPSLCRAVRYHNRFGHETLDEQDFLLELLLRESARITDGLKIELPLDLEKVLAHLHPLIPDARQTYHKALEQGIRAQGFPEIIAGVICEVGAGIEQSLLEMFQARSNHKRYLPRTP